METRIGLFPGAPSQKPQAPTGTSRRDCARVEEDRGFFVNEPVGIQAISGRFNGFKNGEFFFQQVGVFADM